ncbi:MAG: tRNA (adenosine(37)-N6)-threonylcarbamoyltransferase complex transferase subunit TsaD [Patescibacteria group bacterium]|nr:tRNA (adenosine(37)-N6)-threonylcarbamoyltransferase complex transferase subunit TsaD [Patescibacteria group bacterium]
MRILAIETSCDETAAAVVEDGEKILSSVIASSQDFHKTTGGIIPESAAREQIKYIIPVLTSALSKLTEYTGLKDRTLSGMLKQVDALAVTYGPGLIGSLLVGVETAKTLAYITGKEIIPVNHIFAHIYANWLGRKKPEFPAIALVVSGGHTELFYMEGHKKIKWLGGTRDDAAGEAFDKTARLLSLGYPGGPAIAKAAEKSKKTPTTNHQLTTNIKLPRPMIGGDSLEFSFSGLKTAVLREVNRLKAANQLNKKNIAQLSYEIQESITDVLVKKTLFAARRYKAESIIIGGGVAANKRLKEKLGNLFINHQPSNSNYQLFIPPPPLCTDNASYIASFAYFHYYPVPWEKIQAVPDLNVEV